MLRNMDVSLTVKNAGDAGPMLAPQTFTLANADISIYDALGRTWAMAVNVRF